MSEKNVQPRRRGGMGGPPGMGPVDKPKNFKGTLVKLAKYISTYKYTLALVILFTIAGTVFSIIGPDILGQAITEIYTGLIGKVSGTGGIDFGKVGGILLTLGGLYGLSMLFDVVMGILMATVSQKMSFRLRGEMSEKIHRMPMRYFESKTVGEILSRITNDIDTLGMNLSQSITTSIKSTATIIGVLIMMLRVNPIMTLIAIIILPISMSLIMFIVKKSQKHFVAQQRLLGEVNGQVEEVYSGQNIVKVFGREQAVVDEFMETNKKLHDSAWKSQFLSGLMMPIMTFVGNIGYVAVAVVGGVFAARGSITVGNIQAFIQYVRSFTSQTGSIAQVANMLQSTAAAAERVFEFLEEEEETVTGNSIAVPSDIHGAVEFRDVRFGYNPDKIIINDFSAKIEPGQMVAIVGPTGAGKTTIVKLLMRFYDINNGAILVDGEDIRDFERGELREVFGMVLQDTWLFKGTVMENIRYGRLDATDEEVMEAAKAAHVHHFIQTLAGGYNCELSEDATNISQGQRQLLTIARAILANNKIMILDEATSSVDTRTEQRIQRAMQNLMKGRTSFVIAHRLSTIKGADLILVMRDGDIVEQGNHDELIALHGFYYELYYSQFENASA